MKKVRGSSRTVRIRDLRRLEVACFAIGFVSAILILLVAVKLQGGALLGAKKYDYYRGMDKSFGKYYQIEELAKRNSIYSFSVDGLDDEMAGLVLAGIKDDEYARYYTAEEYEQYKQAYNAYVGIGVAMSEVDGDFVITRVNKGGPSDEAGLKVNDVVTEIDGKSLKSLEEASKLISGENGTTVKLTVERDGKTSTYEVTRTLVDFDSVDYRVYDKKSGIGYIQVSSFTDGTAKSFKSAVKDLKNQKCDKLIIDLRGNLGGKEKAGIELADILLPSCVILKEKDSKGKETTWKSKQSSIGMKYVILVDENTASASEAVASAVKVNGGGKLIGVTTYGKGLTQAMHEFKDGTAFKYTVSEFFAADGSKINGVGVKPDIEARGDKVLEEAVKALR